MKIFIASISTETNTFSPIPTGYRSYESSYLVRGGQHAPEILKSSVPAILFRRWALELGWEFVDSLHASAEPAGATVRKVYEGFREEILADLRAAMPVDAVFLPLHGAMVADGYDDCEGDLITRCREIVGNGVPIGVQLDPHCHLTPAMTDNATVIVMEREYPHTDFAERAADVFRLVRGVLAGEIQPRMSVFDCRMIGIYQTTREPMRGFVDAFTALEGKDGVLSISVAHGFPWGDVPPMGTKILVVTDNDAAGGAALAEKLGRQLFDLRYELRPHYLSIDDALDAALAAYEANPGKPVVIADVTDNPGGGAPGDSTFLLRAILERKMTGVVLGALIDPTAVGFAHEAGEGAHLDLRIGGKLGVASGDPLDLSVTVIKTGVASQGFGNGDERIYVEMGDSAVVRVDGIDILMASKRNQAYGTDLFTGMGVDLESAHFIVVKSSQHFYAAYAPLASAVVYCTPPGTLQTDFLQVPYKRIDKHKFPFVEDPFAE